VRPDGSVAQTATYDRTGALTGQRAVNGSSPSSTWARAQSWALLGFADAARWEPELLAPATAIADWLLAHLPPGRVCYWDFDDPAIPDAPLDTSATAIAAAALQKLPDRRYQEAAGQLLDALAGHVNRYGALVDGCYNRVKGIATSNELIWGDYFLLAATLARAGRLPDDA
jgi:unsaturated chondroitin disaccharide hydrolase